MFAASLLVVAACDGADDQADAATAPDAAQGVDAGPPPLDDAPHKGPWVQQPTTTGATVRWETQIAPAVVGVEVTPESGGSSLPFDGVSRETTTQLSYGVDSPVVDEPDVPGTYFVNEVRVDGLEPARCYTYRLVGWPTEGGRFCTLHEPSDTETPIRFFVMGDTSPGIGGTLRLIEAAAPETAEFTVHVGDLQYYTSIVESQQSWFRWMRPLLSASAFMPCVGNHEVDEIPYEYVDYYQRLLTPAAHSGNDRWYHFESGGVWFFSLSTEHDLSEGSEQLTWFEDELERGEADPDFRFAVLYLHRPLYSLGDYRPRASQREALLPILERYRVPLVLAGHNHAYERFEWPDATHVVSGAGGFVDSTVDVLVAEYPEWAEVRAASGLFLQSMFFEVVRADDGTDRIRGQALDDLGMLRDSFERVVPSR